jgi:hypothetical protein
MSSAGSRRDGEDCPRCDYDYRGEYPWGTYERRWCDACLAVEDDEAMRIAEIDIEVAAINSTRGVC